jgi:hypothetical protein
VVLSACETGLGRFAGLFRDPVLGDRLSEPEQRSALVRDLGRVMVEHQWRWFEDLYRASQGRVATGHPNLFELLSEFIAYRDPVRKKSAFVLALMRNSGLWTYVDDGALGPPVDYHEVRGHLRIGTVVVTDQSLRRKLMNDVPVTAEEDIAIRRAVYDAIMLISEDPGLRNPSQLHDHGDILERRKVQADLSPATKALSATCGGTSSRR